MDGSGEGCGEQDEAAGRPGLGQHVFYLLYVISYFNSFVQYKVSYS